jgi:hypothetical protein
MNRLKRLASVCALATSTACAGVPPSTATFENTTVPVSIGPVQKLGGEPV